MISKNQIKFVKSLQNKKNRILHKSFVVEGTKNVLELIRSDYRLLHLFATKEWVDNNLENQNFDFYEVNSRELSRMSGFKNASSVIAVFDMNLVSKNTSYGNINVVLDDIRDPGNLGSIIRTCDWFNVNKIYCSENSVDVYNPKVLQSTMGSISRVNVEYVKLKNFLQDLSSEIPVYGSFLDGDCLSNVNFSSPCFIVFGNESKGISSEISDIVTHRVTIPGGSNMNSLNVSVSAGIMLNKLVNQ